MDPTMSHRRPTSSLLGAIPPRQAAWLAGLLAIAVLGAGVPTAALAKSTRSHKKKGTTTPAATEETPEAVPEAAQAPELTPPPASPAEAPAVEAPPPVPAARPAPTPTVDASGRLLYGPPGPGTGTVVVKGSNLQVSLDGTPIGNAPLTIYNVPKGDYVVEGTRPDGTVVSRPVGVIEDTEAVADLGTAAMAALSAASGTGPQSRHLPRTSKILLGVAGGALAAGLVFGLLELKAHDDYEHAPPDQATLDDLARTGRRDALIANVSFIACAGSLIASALVALPSLLKTESAAPAPVTLTASASASRGSLLAGVALRF
jgi:hypothetical protein